MIKMTLDDLVAWRPCWIKSSNFATKEKAEQRYNEGMTRILAIMGDRDEWTLKDLQGLQGTPGLSDLEWLWLMGEACEHCGLLDEVTEGYTYDDVFVTDEDVNPEWGVNYVLGLDL